MRQAKAPERGEDPDKAWQWTPGDLRMPISALADRYEPEVFKTFSDYAQRTFVDFADGRRTLWDWLYDPIREQAAGECAAYGVTSGKEMAIALDYDTGRRIGSAKGERGRVNVAALLDEAKTKGLQLSLIHNHLFSGYPSPEDVLRLADSAVRDVTSAAKSSGSCVKRGADVSSFGAGLVKTLKAFSDQQKGKTMILGDWLNLLDRLNRNGVIQWTPR